jgi:hypothetical protein
VEQIQRKARAGGNGWAMKLQYWVK